MTLDVLAKIATLDSMTGPELRALWKEEFNEETSINKKGYLITRLAYRIQEKAYGGLSEDTQELLETLVNGDDQQLSNHGRLHVPPVGTKLIREYKNVNHEVMVTRTGFEYKGQTYKSLSEIAREITGTRWSGPVFFGLKIKRKKSTNNK